MQVKQHCIYQLIFHPTYLQHLSYSHYSKSQTLYFHYYILYISYYITSFRLEVKMTLNK